MLLAKNQIKNIQKIQKYECTICYAVDPTIMRCSGPCKASICLKCATSICRTKKQPSCPQRCSSPLNLEPIPNLQIQFKCPYDAQKCKQTIEGNQAFADHCEKCEYMTQDAVDQKLKRAEFICYNGHPLLFLDAETSIEIFNEISLESVVHQCAKCKEVRICRAYCKQCSSQQKHVAYCHDCRPLPFTKDNCPLGHQFVKEKVQDDSLDCDLCGSCIFLYSDEYYHDQKCNFGFCGPCYKKSPEQCHLIPLQSNLTKSLAQNKGEMQDNFQVIVQHEEEENEINDDSNQSIPDSEEIEVSIQSSVSEQSHDQDDQEHQEEQNNDNSPNNNHENGNHQQLEGDLLSLNDQQ